MKIHILSLSISHDGAKNLIHPALIEEKGELILFDAGYPGQGDQIVGELQRLGFNLSDLSKIVVSHHDHDHMGSLRWLKERHPKIEVLSSADEAPYISGKKTSLRVLQAREYNQRLTGEAREAGEGFVLYLERVEHCPVDRTLEDGEYLLPGLKVIFTPGHTPGHISLLAENEGLLLSADALALENGKLIIPNPQFTLNMPKALESVKKLGMLDIKRILCYHGGNLVEDPGKALAGILSGTQAE